LRSDSRPSTHQQRKHEAATMHGLVSQPISERLEADLRRGHHLPGNGDYSPWNSTAPARAQRSSLMALPTASTAA
jgi:hypothetical protein